MSILSTHSTVFADPILFGSAKVAFFICFPNLNKTFLFVLFEFFKPVRLHLKRGAKILYVLLALQETLKKSF